jgi:rhamnose utilization protein RhaD (predicted bifunctional aldolase and dehydrogenase)
MISQWNDAEAAACGGELGARIYTSRLLGRNPALVLYGGGNTSFKQRDTLFVKASGCDLAHADDGMFCALPLSATPRLLEREHLTNADVKTLLASSVNPPGRQPSIETLMHAILPYRYVEHTHADSILAVINTQRAERIAASVYGDAAPLVPYRHSGVELARACMRALEEHGTGQTIGLLLQFHGVVAFGDTARQSYENMIRLVTLAEDYLKAQGAWNTALDGRFTNVADRPVPEYFQAEVARVAGMPLAVRRINDPPARVFALRDDLPVLSQRGPSTPQHAVHTKRVPQLGWDVKGYAARYTQYLVRTLGRAALLRIDPAPRIVIDPGAGIFALGVDDRSAAVAAEFYVHDMEVMVQASAHDRYLAAPEEAIAQAELEYGGFEMKIREQTMLRGEGTAHKPGAPAS